MNGSRFRPWVFDAARTYTLRVGKQIFAGQKPSSVPDDRTLKVQM